MIGKNFRLSIDLLAEINRINSLEFESVEEVLKEFLLVGKKYFQLEYGIVSRVIDDKYVVLSAVSPKDEIKSGDTYELQNTYCHRVVAEKKTYFIHCVSSDATMSHHPVYLAMGLESFVGSPIFINGEVFGTLNFSSTRKIAESSRDNLVLFNEFLSQILAKNIKADLVHKEILIKKELLKKENKKLKNQLRINKTLEKENRAHKGLAEKLQVIAQIGQWEYDVATQGLEWGDVVYQIHGLDPKDGPPPVDKAINFYAPHERQRITDYLTKCVEGGESYHDDFEFIDAQNNKKWVNAFGEAIKDDEGLIVTIRGYFQDITDTKLREKEIEHLKNVAEKGSKTKSKFIASMSHELRTPLNAIIGYSELIEDEIEFSTTEQLLDDVKKIKHSGLYLLTLINQILDIAKIEAGKVSVNTSKFNLKDLQNQIEPICTPVVLKKKNQLIFTGMSEAVEVESDREKMAQVLINLISNAAKFTENGKITVTSRVVGENLEVSVEDNGIGMPKEKLDKIFNRFQQLDSKFSGETEGTGLGLTICKEFLKLMHGDISVKSQEGEGSVFELHLPLRISRKQKDIKVA